MNKTIIAILLISIVSCNNLRDLAGFDWNKVYNDLVTTHNAKRKKHGAKALTKLAALANLCQNTVNTCKKKKAYIIQVIHIKVNQWDKIYMYLEERPLLERI